MKKYFILSLVSYAIVAIILFSFGPIPVYGGRFYNLERLPDLIIAILFIVTILGIIFSVFSLKSKESKSGGICSLTIGVMILLWFLLTYIGQHEGLPTQFVNPSSL